VALPYLVLSPRHYPAAAHKFGILAVEFVTMVFWFGGFIALAVYVTAFLSCIGSVCSAAQAATTFASLDW
jgi:hypothetical protein